MPSQSLNIFGKTNNNSDRQCLLSTYHKPDALLSPFQKDVLSLAPLCRWRNRGTEMLIHWRSQLDLSLKFLRILPQVNSARNLRTESFYNYITVYFLVLTLPIHSPIHILTLNCLHYKYENYGEMLIFKPKLKTTSKLYSILFNHKLLLHSNNV